MIDPWRPGWFRAVRRRAGRDRPAHLVRLAAPAVRRLDAGHRRPRLARRARRRAGRAHARRLLPGGAAGARRLARRRSSRSACTTSWCRAGVLGVGGVGARRRARADRDAVLPRARAGDRRRGRALRRRCSRWRCCRSSSRSTRPLPDGSADGASRPRRSSARWWAAAPAALAGVLAIAFVGTGLAVDRFDAAIRRPTN